MISYSRPTSIVQKEDVKYPIFELRLNRSMLNVSCALSTGRGFGIIAINIDILRILFNILYYLLHENFDSASQHYLTNIDKLSVEEKDFVRRIVKNMQVNDKFFNEEQELSTIQNT